MLDVFTMLPFAVSSVMIGLGVMLGMIRIDAEFSTLYGRLSVSSCNDNNTICSQNNPAGSESIDPMYDECTRTLGISKFKRFFTIKVPMLRGSILVRQYSL